MSRAKMRTILLHLPEVYIQALDSLVPKRYPDRSEAIRFAIRDFLAEEVWYLKKLRRKRRVIEVR